MTDRLSRQLATLLLLVLGTSLAHADPLQTLNELLVSHSNVHARFEQTVKDEQGRLLQQTSGVLWAQRPDRFRWESAEPFPQVLVSDGETLWIYDADLEQVSVRKLDRKLAHTPALLLSGSPAQIAKAFRVEAVPLDDPSRQSFDLAPLDAEAPFARLRVEFAEQRLAAMRLNDNLGQYTEIRFFDLQADVEPEPARFRFELPPGVDVIYQ